MNATGLYMAGGGASWLGGGLTTITSSLASTSHFEIVTGGLSPLIKLQPFGPNRTATYLIQAPCCPTSTTSIGNKNTTFAKSGSKRNISHQKPREAPKQNLLQQQESQHQSSRTRQFILLNSINGQNLQANSSSPQPSGAAIIGTSRVPQTSHYAVRDIIPEPFGVKQQDEPQQHIKSNSKNHFGAGHLETSMLFKQADGLYSYNNITLKSCRDVLKPKNVDRCVLTDYIEDCANDEGLIDYVAFFFCAFSPEKMPLALFISIVWLLTLFVATGVTATDFLCPSLFMISKTLGLSQNIAGVTFLAFGNTSADIFAGSGTLITTAIVGCVFAIKDFRLDKLIFVRDTLFYLAAVSLLFYIFTGPGRIRLQDSVYLLALYLLYVAVVLASKYFTKDRPLKNLHGDGPNHRRLDDDEAIEFEGIQIDDDPTASMVVMRRFLFLSDDLSGFPETPAPQRRRHGVTGTAPAFVIDKSSLKSALASGLANGDTVNSDTATGLSVGFIGETGNGNASNMTTLSNLTLATNNSHLSQGKPSRRVTLFEENLFTGVNTLSPAGSEQKRRRSRSASLISLSKQQLDNLRRASKDIRRQSMDFLAAVSPIDLSVWKQRNWGGKTMELIKAPIRLFLLITTPMADVEGRDEWNKPLSALHCMTGPIFVVFAFGYGLHQVGPFSLPVWIFLISAPISLLMIFTSTSETPPAYYNAYSSYLGFLVAITWIYTISSEVINLLRALGIAFNLSNEIMGLTILAWGNCMLDFITNVSIARKGLPKMAIAACYGGPLMSTLVGIGLPAFVTLSLDPNHNTTLGSSPLLHIIFCFLVLGLLSSLVIVIILRFNVKRGLGIYLIGLYLFLILAEWLTEFQLIPADLLSLGGLLW